MKQIINLMISLVVFIIAIGIANFTGIELIVTTIFLAFIIQWLAFIPAYVFQTEKFYDLTGSLTYLTVIWFVLIKASDSFEIGNTILVLFISAWALRLGSFLFFRIKKDGEDKRFRSIKPSATQFFMTWTLQGLWVSMCSMCALTAIASESGIVINAMFFIGAALFISGLFLEVVADRQKTEFRSIPENRDRYITSGLWAKSRHPNFFGEVILWLGVAVISFSSLQGLQYITLISPIFTYCLLVYVSGVRMLEARADKQWGNEEEYKKYKENTPTLFFNFLK